MQLPAPLVRSHSESQETECGPSYSQPHHAFQTVLSRPDTPQDSLFSFPPTDALSDISRFHSRTSSLHEGREMSAERLIYPSLLLEDRRQDQAAAIGLRVAVTGPNSQL
jgi:hypothetical protein